MTLFNAKTAIKTITASRDLKKNVRTAASLKMGAPAELDRVKAENVQLKETISHVLKSAQEDREWRDLWETEVMGMREQFPGGLSECKEAIAALKQLRGQEAASGEFDPGLPISTKTWADREGLDHA